MEYWETKTEIVYLEKLVEVLVVAVGVKEDEAEGGEKDNKHFENILKKGEVSLGSLCDELEEFSEDKDEEEEDCGVEESQEAEERQEQGPPRLVAQTVSEDSY